MSKFTSLFLSMTMMGATICLAQESQNQPEQPNVSVTQNIQEDSSSNKGIAPVEITLDALVNERASLTRAGNVLPANIPPINVVLEKGQSLIIYLNSKACHNGDSFFYWGLLDPFAWCPTAESYYFYGYSDYNPFSYSARVMRIHREKDFQTIYIENIYPGKTELRFFYCVSQHASYRETRLNKQLITIQCQ